MSRTMRKLATLLGPVVTLGIALLAVALTVHTTTTVTSWVASSGDWETLKFVIGVAIGFVAVFAVFGVPEPETK